MSYSATRRKRFTAGVLAGAMALTVMPILGFTGVAGADHIETADPIGEGNVCEGAPAEDPFIDVGDDDIAVNEIRCMVNAGPEQITHGTTATTYSPNDPVTRRQMVLFLWRVGQDAEAHEIGDAVTALPEGDGEVPFSDIEDNDPAFPELDSLNEAVVDGQPIAEGFPDGTFRPNEPVSRRQMAHFIVRIQRYLAGADFPPEPSQDYFDDDNGDTGEESLNILAEEGVFTGVAEPHRSVEPGEDITRRQMAFVLTRKLEVLFEAGVIDRLFAAAGQSGQIVDEVPGVSYTFVDDATGEVVTVEYDADDTFTVDGATVSLAVFSAAVDPGDEVNFLDDTSTTDADEHHLTNVDVTSGMVGNVNTTAQTFEIINETTGTTVGGPFTYGGADDAYTVDGASATEAGFEGAINEGDSVAVDESGTTDTFDLTNETVSGTVSDTTIAAGVTTEFAVDGALGDDHVDADDLLYEAAAADAATETYTVDGAAATYAEFEAAINDGDQITYSRTGGAESFALTNEAPTAVSGQGVDDLEPVGDTFTVATATGDEVVDYTGTTQYVVDGVVVTEAEFEAAYSAGDEVTFQAGDPDTSTAQSLELTNQQLSGQLSNPNVGVIGTDDAPPADTYDVLAANGTTVLDTVDYTADITGSGGDRYFVNGGEVNLAEWEERLDELDLAADDQDDVVTVVDGTLATEHRLTTDDPDLP